MKSRESEVLDVGFAVQGQISNVEFSVLSLECWIAAFPFGNQNLNVFPKGVGKAFNIQNPRAFLKEV